MLGKTISHYLIIDKLGEGGMGTVYLAEDTHLRRRVAFKSLKVSPAIDRRQYKARFLREARLASTLNHANIVSIYDYGETEDGSPYLVMELVSGQTLADILQQNQLAVGKYVEIIKQVAVGLDEAHRHGIVHRDLKPSNIILNERNQVKILDFGLAKLLDKDNYGEDDSTAAGSALATQTREGVYMGTPSYSSPEQILGTDIDKRSDIFSLGAVLYECISGRAAFAGDNFAEISAQVIRDNPPPPSQINSSVSSRLDAVALKALAKKAENRYQNAAELIEDLESAESGITDQKGFSRQPVSQLETKVSTGFSRSKLLLFFKQYRFFAVVLLVMTAAALFISTQDTVRKLLWSQSARQLKPSFNEGVAALRSGNYYKASKLLEDAIQSDERFPMAHARLAEAWIELGYEDRAISEIIRVTELTPAFSNLSQLDTLYLQAVAATVRRNYKGAVENNLEIVRQIPEEEKKFALFDLGRAYEKNEQTNQAIETLEEVVRLDENFAAAFLRLGILYGRRQETEKANAAFSKAEKLYGIQSDYDGRAEVFFQRGNLLNIQDKLPAAREQMQRAHELAAATGNPSLQVRILLHLSSISYSLGDNTAAKQYINQAIELGRAEQLENLTTAGIIDTGNIFLTRGEYVEAENNFNQALQLAKANNWQRIEARAGLSLGSLYFLQGRSVEAIRYIEPALKFYQQSNSQKEALQAQLALGYANDQIGNYDAALESSRQQIELADQLGDTSLIAHIHAFAGLVMIHQERFPEALESFARSFELNKSLGLTPKMGYDTLNRGQILWQLGRYNEAFEALGESSAIAGTPEKGDKQLLAWIYLLKAQIALSVQDNRLALTESQKSLETAGGQSREIFIQATYIKGLARSRSGALQSGKDLCREAFEAANQTGISHLIQQAQLALAETLLADGETAQALSDSLQVQETSARLNKKHSQWRALAIAARASSASGDKEKARDYAARASEVLSELETLWGNDNYQSYLARRDIQFYRKLLES
ncbi:MAG TPA: protein kinase [Pyrinomonadaceae bacterium]|jgi:serine/threonine protein kinase